MSMNDPVTPAFDFNAVFDVDDYMCFYRDLLDANASDADVAAIVKLLDLTSPMQILDLACGFGRHANRLAALGHDVTGVDFMPGFLDIARADAEQMGVQVTYLQEDMRHINYSEKFDRALILFATFGFFDDDDNLRVIKNLARALKPGGLLAFDTNNRDVVLKSLPPFNFIEKDDNLMVRHSSFDMLTGRWNSQRIVMRNGVKKYKPSSRRLYSATEARDLLIAAGLTVHRIYGGWQGQPLSTESTAMVVIAQKLA